MIPAAEEREQNQEKMTELGNGWAAGPDEPTRWTTGMSRVGQQQRSSLAEASWIVRGPLPVSTLTHTMGAQMELNQSNFGCLPFYGVQVRK